VIHDLILWISCTGWVSESPLGRKPRNPGCPAAPAMRESWPGCYRRDPCMTVLVPLRTSGSEDRTVPRAAELRTNCDRSQVFDSTDPSSRWWRNACLSNRTAARFTWEDSLLRGKAMEDRRKSYPLEPQIADLETLKIGHGVTWRHE
jgi:hypothetical protein